MRDAGIVDGDVVVVGERYDDEVNNNAGAAHVFRFDVPLENKSLRWLQWRDGRFETFVPPPIGPSRASRQCRWMSYSIMYPAPPCSCSMSSSACDRA